MHWAILKGDPSDLSKGICVLQALDAAAVAGCFSVSVWLRQHCHQRVWKEMVELGISYGLVPVSLNLCRLCAEEPATCPLKGSNTGVATMIDEAAAGDGSCRCAGFFLKAVSREASTKTGVHSTVLS